MPDQQQDEVNNFCYPCSFSPDQQKIKALEARIEDLRRDIAEKDMEIARLNANDPRMVCFDLFDHIDSYSSIREIINSRRQHRSLFTSSLRLLHNIQMIA